MKPFPMSSTEPSGGFRRLASRDGMYTVSTTTIITLVYSA